ncbi:MAG: GHKL domain-containing protein [Lachnospiraceae bacterium]|nr:GHKL domain-containing protein [Lachnospiraceae bacterium]
MTIGIFQFNRISLLFQMIFLYKFTPHRYGRKLTICIADDTGLPMSHHGAGHGYGMNSIKSFADKYGATFTWSTDNHIFTSKLLIKM